MNAPDIVHVLLDEAEEFDAREYLTQSTLEGTAKRLGFEWLHWGVWYKEIGPWRVYVDPYSDRPLMEVEIGCNVTRTGEADVVDQIPVFHKVVNQADAYEILPKVIAALDRQKESRKWQAAREEINVAFQDFRPMESQEFDARNYFADMELPGMRVADALGFDCRIEPSCSPKKVIGQWIVYITPGSNYNLVNVYRDYGWQSEPKGQWYLKDAEVERVLTEIVHILQTHTNEQGWAQDEKEAYRKLAAIPA